KLWVNARGWQPSGGGLGAWLRRIATNACLDRLRRPRHLSDDALPERADDAPGADVLIDAERRRAAVQAAIQRLPDRQRAAIVLTYHEGDRKSTRLNSSHSQISYAVFCLKKKKKY